MPVHVETAKKSKRPSREVISCVFEPEGNACSLTDSTAEEHVLALVEHAANEAWDRISRLVPGGKVGYLKKNGDGSLLYSVVNTAGLDADEEETHPVDLSSLSSKLLPGFTTLGFWEERRSRVTFLSSASTALSTHNSSVFGDLKADDGASLHGLRRRDGLAVRTEPAGVCEGCRELQQEAGARPPGPDHRQGPLADALPAEAEEKCSDETSG